MVRLVHKNGMVTMIKEATGYRTNGDHSISILKNNKNIAVIQPGADVIVHYVYEEEEENYCEEL